MLEEIWLQVISTFIFQVPFSFQNDMFNIQGSISMKLFDVLIIHSLLQSFIFYRFNLGLPTSDLGFFEYGSTVLIQLIIVSTINVSTLQ